MFESMSISVAETVVVLFLAACGVLMGLWFSRLRASWWVTGYFVPLCFVAMVAIARFLPRLEFAPPYHVADGRQA